MKTNDDVILEVLQGFKADKWPKAALVKVFIACTGEDFVEERRQLLENLGPDLQAIYDDKSIEIEFVDVHYGKTEFSKLDSTVFQDHLLEIKNCFDVSRSCFFLCLIGDRYEPFIIPNSLDLDIFNALLNKCKQLGLESELLEKLYVPVDGRQKVTIQQRQTACDKWECDSARINHILQSSAKELIKDNSNLETKLDFLFKSSTHQQFQYAVDLAGNKTSKIIAVFRKFEDVSEKDAENNATYFDPTNASLLNSFKETIRNEIHEDNCIELSTKWIDDGVDPDNDEHEQYLQRFYETVKDTIIRVTNQNLRDEPELMSRKKIVQENFQENVTHLSIVHDLLNPSNRHVVDEAVQEQVDIVLEKIRVTLLDNHKNPTKHSPIIIHGPNGTGKTTCIKAIFNQCEAWFNTNAQQPIHLIRFIRFAASTPRSAYSLELLRVICQQICIVLKLPDGFLPKDASFDPLYINNWFQSLLKRFEELTSHVLVILIDDLHKLNPLDSDIVAALSWIPLNLPRNVFLIFGTSLAVDQLKLTPIQKEKFRNADVLFPIEIATSKPTYLEKIEKKVVELEEIYTSKAMSHISTLITCTEYGLSEMEYLELVMPTGDIDGDILLSNGNFNFSTFSSMRYRMDFLIRQKLMSGKLLIEWSHDTIKDFVKKRYLFNQEFIRNTHSKIVNLFFNEFERNEEDTEEEEVEQSNRPVVVDIKDTPFQSTLHSAVSYSLRHVEESWIHLLKAGDSTKLKTMTVCNFDFLLAAVQMISVSYLRCILEHVRCYLLDRDLELVYYTIRKSSDVLTRDPLQLGAQIISWLRPSADSQSPILSLLLTQAMAWCDGFKLPLLVPLTCWLSSPLGSCVGRGIQVTNVYQCVVTPPGQHVVCVSEKNQMNSNEPTLWHVMSKQLVHTFKGHSGPVLCMHITKQSQYLITGSADISIIVWDLKTLSLKLRIYEHIAPVLCLTSALNNSIIISGGDDSSIIVTSLSDGKLIMKLDHHRGPVTSVEINSTGDILISASLDKSACLWSLENFTLLNTINFTSPIKIIDVSSDSVFLLAACVDNNLYLRTLATGTELHSLSGHKGKIKSLCIAQDSCRAVVGCSDGRVYIYDMHSGQIVKTITGQGDEVTCVCVTDKDDFLITVGGGKVYFYPFRETDAIKPVLSKLNKKSQQTLQAHTSYLTCVDISRDNQLAASGSADNLVNIWLLGSQELTQTLEGHTAAITCINFAPNGLFVVSGSDDRTLKVWGLTLGSIVAVFTSHQSSITAVSVMLDSCRVISGDKDRVLLIWLADDGTLLQSVSAPSEQIAVTNNMKYVACSNGDNQLKIWSLLKDDEKYNVCHSEEITCFVITMDSLQVITGSRDMSLKVWQLAGGKLSQVLVGHTDAVTCVAISALDKNMVVSGSCDGNCIVWDINTGDDLHTLQGHLAPITCVRVSPDGSLAVSGSEDKTIIVWDTKRGIQLTSLQLHITITDAAISCDCSRVSVIVKDTKYLPIICLHNTPAKYIKLPTYCAPAKDVEARVVPKRQIRRLLKKEVSLDTYTWQKKYGHLTSNIMIAAVDERLKRRFSVSASMEEISKIPQQNKTLINQGQGSLAQSQHFDQLEALWSKRSPPQRRKITQSLSKQSSLVESRFSSEEEDEDDQLGELPRRS